jgi:hypothetical protein
MQQITDTPERFYVDCTWRETDRDDLDAYLVIDRATGRTVHRTGWEVEANRVAADRNESVAAAAYGLGDVARVRVRVERIR